MFVHNDKIPLEAPGAYPDNNHILQKEDFNMKKPENANANANNTKAIKVDSYRVLRAVCVGETHAVG